MFTDFFPFTKINHQRRNREDHSYVEHNYTFKGKMGKRYVVIAEQYNYALFAIKFCLCEHKFYPDRFNRLTNFNECSRVITTVGQIIKEVSEVNPIASFVFMGSELPGEEKTNTKRFKLYERIIGNIVSPVKFEHFTSKSKSAYLLLNRNNPEPDLLNKVSGLLEQIFVF